MECNRCGKEAEYSQSGLCKKCSDEITDKNGKAYTLREATKIIDDLKERVEALEARLATY